MSLYVPVVFHSNTKCPSSLVEQILKVRVINKNMSIF